MNLETAAVNDESAVPVVDAPEGLFKLAQDFGGSGPLHVAAVVLHGPHVFEAAVHLSDVGLDFVAAVGLEDDEGRTHPPVAHPGYGASPHLQQQHHNNKRFRVTL